MYVVLDYYFLFVFMIKLNTGFASSYLCFGFKNIF